MSATLLGNIKLAIPAYYVLLSLVTFCFYGLDKARSRRKGQRVPEKTLHILSLVGGWPGALAAQRIMRHKVQKKPFLLCYWLTVILNVVVLGALFLLC